MAVNGDDIVATHTTPFMGFVDDIAFNFSSPNTDSCEIQVGVPRWELASFYSLGNPFCSILYYYYYNINFNNIVMLFFWHNGEKI